MFAATLALGVLLAACSSSGDDGADPTGEPPSDATSSTVASGIDAVRINELQVIGSHNSYHLAQEGGIATALSGLAPDFWSELDYSHLPLTEQLEEHGIRQFELDVFADPDGGLFANRAALEIVGEDPASGLPELDEPGFKVLHIQDFDFGTTCLTFVACLEEIEAWSTANPSHAPIMIMVETKTQTIEEGAESLGIDLSQFDVDWAQPLDMTSELFADLEGEVLSVLGEDQIITPDDVRGEYETLHEAVGAEGWPTLGDARGKVIFSLVDTGASADVYRADSPALEGRLFFTSATAGEPDAAFVRVDDPIVDADALADALAAGYLVRTRSDVPTVEAQSGDTTRRDAALASGAQYVSTDFYVDRPDFEAEYVVELPGGAIVRCSPASASETCDDSELGGDL